MRLGVRARDGAAVDGAAQRLRALAADPAAGDVALQEWWSCGISNRCGGGERRGARPRPLALAQHRARPGTGRPRRAPSLVVDGAVGLHPGEHPVDHPEQQHRQRLVSAASVRSGRSVATARAKPITTSRSLASTRSRSRARGTSRLRSARDAHPARCAYSSTRRRISARIWLRPSFPRTGLRARCLEPRDMAVRDADQQRVLVLVVVVQRGFGEPTGLRHLVHRRAGVAAVREQRRGAREDHLALVVVSGGAASWHVSPSQAAARRGTRSQGDRLGAERVARPCSPLVERQHDPVGQRVCLTRQHEARGDLVLLERAPCPRRSRPRSIGPRGDYRTSPPSARATAASARRT